VNGRFAAGDDRAPEAGVVQEGGAPQQLFGGVKEQGGLARVAAHRAVVVALLAEAKQGRTAARHRRVLGDALLEQPWRAAGRGALRFDGFAYVHGVRWARPRRRRRARGLRGARLRSAPVQESLLAVVPPSAGGR